LKTWLSRRNGEESFLLLRRAGALLSGALILAGCTTTLKMRTVDARTGEPLAGTMVSWREDYSDLLLGSKHRALTNLPPSDKEGLIIVPESHPKWLSSFVFSHPDYHDLYGSYNHGVLSLAERTNSAVQGSPFVFEGPLTRATSSNGVFLIPMRPSSVDKSR